MEGEIIGAIKIKDGMFIGDEFAAKDLEFVVTNKVTHIINCAGKQVGNFWESIGMSYLTFNWFENDSQVLFDARDEVLNEIYNFVEEAVKAGESVLIHSVRGQSRACCVIAAYFMKRFNWTLYKTLEYLNWRRPDLEIRANFFHQLTALEGKLTENASRNVSANWTDIDKIQDPDELILTNTFLNAKNAPFDEHLMDPNSKLLDLKQKINWSDHASSNSRHRAQSASRSEDRKKDKSNTPVRSILKGSKKLFNFESGEEIKELQNQLGQTSGSLKPNRSAKSLFEERNYDSASSSKPNYTTISGGETKYSKYTANSAGTRGASNNIFDRDEKNGAERGNGGIVEAQYDPKIPSINGNIIHVTVNNYLTPVNPSVTSSNQNPQKNDPKARIDEETSVGTRTNFTREQKNYEADPNSGGYLANKQLGFTLDNKPLRESEKFDTIEEDERRHSSNKDSTNPNFTKYVKKAQSKNGRGATSVSPMLRRGESPIVRKDRSGVKQESESSYIKALSAKSNDGKSNIDNLNYLNKLFPASYMNSSNTNERKTLQARNAK